MKRYRYSILKIFLVTILILIAPISTINYTIADSNLKHDISNLHIEGIITRNIDENENYRTLSITINHHNIHPYRIGLKGFYLNIEDFTPRSIPGEPIIPMKTYKIDLPLKSKITEVGFTSGHYIYIEKPLKPAIAPKPIFWNPSDTTRFTFKVKYDPTKLYPGKLLSYNIGYNREKTRVYIRIYPIQYLSNQILFLTDGIITIKYRIEKQQQNYYNSFSNLIITPPLFYKEARRLKEFHEDQGILTEVINTTWIYENYEEADDPPFPGYADDEYMNDSLKNYNYSLAKKIISYLKDTSTHPDLEYITLFGTAEFIPPSYYYEFYYAPTDIFYASPDYDFLLNYKIGRLPVNSLSNASHIVDKIIHWNSSSDLFRNITIAGGKPFDTPYDIGEMIAIDTINQGFFKGIKPDKCFRTENRFDKYNLTLPLKGGTGILYHIGHGSGDAWYLEGEPIYVDDILNISTNNNLPIIVSIACLNGAFDTQVYETLGFKTSLGEAILSSNAGGIAYIGGSRVNAGMPIFSLYNGSLEILGETYMAAMLTDFFEAYSNNSLHLLGDITTVAMEKYIENHDFDDMLDIYTLFCFTLLGDPVLKIPNRPNGIEYTIPKVDLLSSEGSIDVEDLQLPYTETSNGDIPIYPLLESISYDILSDARELDIKIVDSFVFEKPTVFKKHIDDLQEKPIIYINNSSMYSLRIITPDGKEDWSFLATSILVDDDYNNDTPGFHINRWSTIQEAVNSISKGIIYLKPGRYHEDVLIDKTIMLFGEEASETIIDGNEGDISLRITGDNCIISSLTIRNSIVGVSIESDGNLLINNIIRDNKLNGISIEEKSNFTSFLPNIVAFNRIYNNTNGVYILQSSPYIIFNEILSNNIGVYIKDSIWNTIGGNNISKNLLGVYIKGRSNGNYVIQNNFIDNDRHASFYQSWRNTWFNNYWGRPRILPKIIFGSIGKLGLIPWINIDPMPAVKPLLFSL